jgi:hypothetical protein
MSRLVILSSLPSVTKYREMELDHDVILLTAEAVWSRAFADQMHYVWSTERLVHLSAQAECVNDAGLVKLFAQHSSIFTL